MKITIIILTAACDELQVSSMYGPLGIVSKIDAKDAAPILASRCVKP